jgi:N-dimethylarginine dimethylaminohydrolase
MGVHPRDHVVDVERSGNTYYLDYYGDDEPRGYPREVFPREWEGDIESYPLERYPGYRESRPPDFPELEKYCKRDEIEAETGSIWGGQQGIGKLKKVGIVMPTEHEGNDLWGKDEEFFLMSRGVPDPSVLRAQMERYVDILEGEGVTVHTFEMPKMGTYGPMRKLFIAAEPMITREGAILPRYGHGPYKRGLNKGFQRFLTSIDCPIVHTVQGYGIHEIGTARPIGENAIISQRGLAGNQDGIDQLLPVLARAGIEEVHFAGLPYIEDSFEASGHFHIDGALGILDEGLGIVHPQGLDYDTKRYLSKKGIELIEIPPEEQKQYLVSDIVLLEPGKVLMAAEAEETRIRVEDRGVEVVPVPTSEIMKGGINGILCVTLEPVRVGGPSLG